MPQPRTAPLALALAALWCLLAAPAALAQRPGGAWGGGTPAITGSIEGRVVDAATGQPVEFATLVLKRLASAAPGGIPTPAGTPTPGANRPDSARRAMMLARLTERLGRAPTDEEIERARQRFAGRRGGPAGAPAEETQVDGAVTEVDGGFRFAEVPLGRYAIEASFIGYDAERIGEIEVTGRRPDVTLERIDLAPSAATLETAVVVGEAELIENRVDKVVYNASQDVVNQGGDGADVLRRVPLLSVDLEGNVSLRGSDQVQILINGRPSSMFAGSVGEALQAMPAEEIEKVEVVTSPGARYQGEGTAGIINIVTKRGGLKGLTGSARASIGTRSNNLGANLNYSKGRFGVNGGAGARFSWNRPTVTGLTRVVGDPAAPFSTLVQTAEGNSAWLGLNGNLGAFYDVNAYNAFTTSLRVRGRRRSSDLTQLTASAIPSLGVSDVYTLERDSRAPAFNYDWTTDYKRTFEGEDHDLNVAFQVGGAVRDQDYDRLQLTQAGERAEVDELGRNEGRNLEYTLQADYRRPVGARTSLETGAQLVLRAIASDYRYDRRAEPGVGAYVTVDSISNVFDYDQDVAAGYASVRHELTDAWSLVAGLRYEHTAIAGALERARPEDEPFSNDYDNWLPSASLQYKLSPTSSMRAAYSRRIRRPGLRFVNPFVDLSNPQIVSVGNPQLRPEVTEQYELTGNARLGKGFANLSVFYRTTEGEISGFTQIDGETTATTFLNLGSSETYGANAFATYTIAKVVKLRGGVNVERLGLSGAGVTAGITREVWQYGGNGSLTVELPRDLVVESFGFYRAPRQSLQGEQASFSIWSVGAQKKLAGDRWRVGVRIVEPFSRSKEFPGETSGVNRDTGLPFTQRSEYSVLFRSFGVNASYRFGSLTGNRTRERRSKISNDDVRDGGGGGGEF